MGAMLLAMLAPLVPFVASAAPSVYVAARDDVFDSVSAQVDISGRVTWTNRGHSPHDVVADDGSFVSPTMKPGQTYSQVFPKQGAFKYFCSFHGAAGGSIVAFHAWRQRETWLFLMLQTLAVLCSLVISARDRRGRGVGGKPSPS